VREGGHRRCTVRWHDERAAAVTEGRREVPGWVDSRLKNLEVGRFQQKTKELPNGLHKDLGRD
jgi:hypothetical protein